MRIASRSNPGIKRMRSLRSRAERERTGLFFVEGIQIVVEAVQQNAPIEEMVIAPELLTSAFAQETVQQQKERGVPCLEVTAEVFESLSLKERPQGIGAVVRQRWEKLEQVDAAHRLGWVALEGVQSPGNLGTILRTADAVGAAGVILIGPSTDPYDPTAVRASMGAIFSQRLVRARFEAFAAWKRQTGCRLVGTSPAAATDYRAASYQPPLVLFMGSEQKGLSPEQQALCDLVVRIPMVGRSDSLNLAVATALMLYEIFYQQGKRGVT